MDEQNWRKLDELAREVLILSRNTLLVHLRFLDMALSQFRYQAVEGETLLTDGATIYYDPRYILKCYRSARETPTRDYLHLVLHCVFRHQFMDPALERTYWDLA